MNSQTKFIVEHAFIDDGGEVCVHLTDPMSGKHVNLKIFEKQSEDENIALIEKVKINNGDVLRYTFVINVPPSNFSNYRIMFLMGLVWGVSFELIDNFSMSDFLRLNKEVNLAIVSYSLSYQSTTKSLKEISSSIDSVKREIPRVTKEIHSLKMSLYGILVLGVLLLFFGR
jgi:hypothetical protein